MDSREILTLGQEIKDLVSESWLQHGGIPNELINDGYAYDNKNHAYLHQILFKKILEGKTRTKFVNLFFKSESFEDLPSEEIKKENKLILKLINDLGQEFKKIDNDSPTAQNWIIYFSGSINEIVIKIDPIKDKGFFKHEKRF